MISLTLPVVLSVMELMSRTCFGCAIADDFGFFQLAAQKLTGRVGNA